MLDPEIEFGDDSDSMAVAVAPARGRAIDSTAAPAPARGRAIDPTAPPARGRATDPRAASPDRVGANDRAAAPRRGRASDRATASDRGLAAERYSDFLADPATRGSAYGGVPGRRTVTIRGRGAERDLAFPAPGTARRPAVRRHERPGFKPDRAGLWAVVLGLLLVLVAAASAHGAVPAHARIAPAAARVVHVAPVASPATAAGRAQIRGG